MLGLDTVQVQTIRSLNDTLRQTGMGGRTLLTAGVASLAPDTLAQALRAVAQFDRFNADNDPYGEHDCAAIEAAGHRLFWKIDYFEPDLTRQSDDPANAAITTRILTIMLAEEY